MVGTPGNSINESGTSGICNFDGTASFSTTALTQYNVVSGASANTFNNIAPSTATYVLTSNGPSAQPTFQPVPIQGSLTYYWTNTASDVALELQQTAATFTPKTTQSFAGLGSGNTLLETFITNPGIPGISFLPAGQYTIHLHADQTVGTRVMQIYVEIWEATSAGADITKIGTTESTTAIAGSETEYDIIYADSNVYTFASTTSRVKVKVYASGAVTGSNATINIFVGDTADSRTTLPGPSADVTNFVPYTGAVSDVNLGTHTITANSATLTNALTVANGGTGRQTLTNHGVLVGAATTAITQLAAGTAGQVLQSGGASADPAYSTPTYPSVSGTAGKVLISDGTNNVYSTPTYPNASATSGKIITSDGTNFIASAYTVASPGTSGNVLTSNGTNWTSAPASGGFSPNSTITFYDDFFGSGGQGGLFSYSGAFLTASTFQTTAGYPGIVSNKSFSANNGAAYLGTASNINNNEIVLGGGTFTLNWVFNIQTLSNSTNRYVLQFGLGDGPLTTTQANGCYINYSDNVNSGNWQFICSNASTATTSNSSTLVATGWHNLQISVNAAATSVSFTLDGVSLGTAITTNIPVLGITPYCVISRSSGTIPANALAVDLCYFTYALTSAR